MGTVAAKAIQQNHHRIDLEELRSLAAFQDSRARAVSFYLSSPSFSEKSHRQELDAIKQIGRIVLTFHLDQYPRSNELLADLDGVIEKAEGMENSSLGFRAIFACRGQQVWREFELPIPTPIRFLKADKRFYLAPLVRAMEAWRAQCADQQQPHAGVLTSLHSNSGRGATGLSAVLQKLEEGRVQTLLLGPESGSEILECSPCGRLFTESADSCPACGSAELISENAQEALVRKALLTRTEIVAIDPAEAAAMDPVAALLH